MNISGMDFSLYVYLNAFVKPSEAIILYFNVSMFLQQLAS
jgi:hypothetical protein